MKELVSNIDKRMSWDERWKEFNKLDDAQAHGGSAAHVKLNKPPIPFVS